MKAFNTGIGTSDALTPGQTVIWLAAAGVLPP